MWNVNYGATWLKFSIGGDQYIWVNTSHISTVKQTSKGNSEITLFNGDKIQIPMDADEIVKTYCKEK